MIDLLKIKRIVDIEYKNIVTDSEIVQSKMRIYIVDGSFADIWFSNRIPGRFSYHCEKDTLMERFLDTIIFLIYDGVKSQHFPNIFTMELPKM